MELKMALCPNCGGEIKVDPSNEAGVCPYCGTPFIMEKAIINYNTIHNSTNYNNYVNNIRAEKVELNTKSYFKFLSAGDDSFQKKDYKTALENYQQVLEISPSVKNAEIRKRICESEIKKLSYNKTLINDKIRRISRCCVACSILIIIILLFFCIFLNTNLSKYKNFEYADRKNPNVQFVDKLLVDETFYHLQGMDSSYFWQNGKIKIIGNWKDFIRYPKCENRNPPFRLVYKGSYVVIWLCVVLELALVVFIFLYRLKAYQDIYEILYKQNYLPLLYLEDKLVTGEIDNESFKRKKSDIIKKLVKNYKEKK